MEEFVERRSLRQKRICVIGAGTAGLVATKVAIEEGEGAEVFCLERASDLGGIWWYRPDELEQTTVMEFTVTNTSKEMSAFSDYPPSSSLPAYLPHRDMLAYLRSFAENFGVVDVIRFNSVVDEVKKQEDGRWAIHVKDKLKMNSYTELVDSVMVCIGHHSIPRMPHFRDQHLFKGRIIHGKAFKNADGYRGKRVVVVGFGNSAADIAVSLAGVATKVFASVRRGTWIYPSHCSGVPTDFAMFTRLNKQMPSIFGDLMLDNFLQKNFNHDIIGFTPEVSAAKLMGTMSDALPRGLLCNQIQLCPPIERLTETGVIFQDSDEIVPIDEIIVATGYRPDIPFIDSTYYGKCSEKGDVERLMLLRGLYSARDVSIGFVGMIEAQGNLGQLFEIQARHFMAVFTGRVNLPRTEVARMEEVARNLAGLRESSAGDSERHATMVDKMVYMDELAEEMGIKPNWWSLALRDPQLAFKCIVGPLLPYQYRLVGPYSWAGAREAIFTAHSRQTAFLRAKTPLPRTARPAVFGPHFIHYGMFTVIVVLLGLLVIGVLTALKICYSDSLAKEDLQSCHARDPFLTENEYVDYNPTNYS